MTAIKIGESKNKEQVRLSKAVIVSDIDYTLLDFDPAHQAGIDALSVRLGEEVGGRVHKIFMNILHGIRGDWGHIEGGEAAFKELMQKMEDLQENIVSEHGSAKIWSREAWIYLAAQEFGLSMTEDMLHEARDTYWEALERNIQPYLHALEFFKKVNELKRPVYLHTGSDSILRMNKGIFYYDPDYSHNYKMKRLSTLKQTFPHEGLFIGDCIDKYTPKFAEHVVEEVMKREELKDPRNIIVIGDSFQSDIKWFLDLGAGSGFLIKPGQEVEQKGENLFVVSSLTEIENYLNE